jgi:hypothetical protein
MKSSAAKWSPSVTADYLNMNALHKKMDAERENATQKDHFGLAKLLREKGSR